MSNEWAISVEMIVPHPVGDAAREELAEIGGEEVGVADGGRWLTTTVTRRAPTMLDAIAELVAILQEHVGDVTFTALEAMTPARQAFELTRPDGRHAPPSAAEELG